MGLDETPENTGRANRAQSRAPTTRWSIRVLAVEDDPADAALILEVLQRNPVVERAEVTYEPDVALDELARWREPPDLIFVDINMPRVDGFRFVKALREIPTLRMTPVVFLTTSQLRRDVEEAVRLDANAYLIKPDTRDEWEARMNDIIDKATRGQWGE